MKDIRRKEKTIEDAAELRAILREAKHVTLAMCRDGEPYLVTVNHGFDPERRCLYFHCAREGKKVDILRANPRVWGCPDKEKARMPQLLHPGWFLVTMAPPWAFQVLRDGPIPQRV